MFPATTRSFLPGCSDPVAWVGRLNVACPFFPTEKPSTAEEFSQVRCLLVLQVVRSGSHTNRRKEVWYRVHLINTQGEISEK